MQRNAQYYDERAAAVVAMLDRMPPPVTNGHANGAPISKISGSQLSQPVPLVRPVSAPAPYPIDALGSMLGPAARAIAELVQVPEALAGNSVLAAAGLAAQAHANVQTLGGARPVSLYMLTVAESGERKTTADQIVKRVVEQRAARLQISYGEDLRHYEANMEAHKARVRNVKDSASDPDAIAKGLMDLREELPPRKPFMLVSEPTAEGLILSLKDGQFSQGLFNDEGGAFVGGHALSQEAELRTIAMLSRAWEGAPLDRVRAKDREHVTLYGRRLSLHLLCQPAVASRLLGKALYRSQGFLARFLIAAPASLIGTRVHSGHSIEPDDDARIVSYWRALEALLERRADEDEALGGLSPPCLALSPDARRLLVASYNEIEAAQGGDGELATVREFASKAAEHACRIAAVLTLVRHPRASAVDVEDMERGLKLVEFYTSEQARLIGAASVAPEIENGQKLLDWISRKGLHCVTARDVMRLGPNAIRDADSAKAALKLAESHNWLMTENGTDYLVTPSAATAMREGRCSS